MRIGKLVLTLGVSGIIMITAACNMAIVPVNLDGAGGAEEAVVVESGVPERSIPHRLEQGRRIIRKQELPWLPDPMKVLVLQLGNG